MAREEKEATEVEGEKDVEGEKNKEEVVIEETNAVNVVNEDYEASKD